MSGNNFKATPSAIYVVGVNKDSKEFLVILLFITCSNSAKYLQSFREGGHKKPYWCTKFKGNQFTRKLSLVDSKLAFRNVVRKTKCEENQAFYKTNISRTVNKFP